MAKVKSRPGLVDALAEVPAIAESAATPETPVHKRRWKVSLSCPTPLTHSTLVVEAEGEQAAVQAFFEANGICGSVHTMSVEMLAESQE